MQGHAPSNSNVGARSTKHFVNQSFACEFYPVDRASTMLVGPYRREYNLRHTLIRAETPNLRGTQRLSNAERQRTSRHHQTGD